MFHVFYFVFQAKQRASVKWLLSKAYNNRVPEKLREPYYRDHEVSFDLIFLFILVASKIFERFTEMFFTNYNLCILYNKKITYKVEKRTYMCYNFVFKGHICFVFCAQRNM